MLLLAAILLSTLIKHSLGLCCVYGQSSDEAAQSCAEVLRVSPGCRGLSGYYWVESSNGSGVQVYCDMSTRGGGWERIAYFNSEDSGTTCPGNMGNYQLDSYHVCTNNNGSSNITEAIFHPVASSYSEVMGLMTGYVSGQAHGFTPNGVKVKNLNTVYMDGMSLVIDDNSGFFKHVHSTAVADYANSYSNPQQSCFIKDQNQALPPYTVGRDNTCTLIHFLMYMPLDGTIDPVHTHYFGDHWNGICEVMGYFCRHIERYFTKTLPKEFTSESNPLIVRIMSQSGIVIGMNFLDVYVR